MISLLLSLLTAGSVSASSSRSLDLIAGKSLGEASLGETSAQLLAKSFVVDTSRESARYTYLSKGALVVLLEEGRAVRVCVDAIKKHHSVLRFEGKRFPKSATLEAVAKFLGGCDEDIRGSGGLTKLCVSGKVELTTSFPRNLVTRLCVLN